jgi:hypothetical protein
MIQVFMLNMQWANIQLFLRPPDAERRPVVTDSQM